VPGRNEQPRAEQAPNPASAITQPIGRGVGKGAEHAHQMAGHEFPRTTEVPLISVPAATSWRAEEQDDGERFSAQNLCFAFF
jgi:hypothetical protein